MRIFNQHVPSPILLLVGAEWALAAGSVYLAGLIRFVGDWDAVQRYAGSMVAQAIVFGVVVVLCIAAMGLYHARQRARIEGVIARVVIAVALAAVALTLVYFVFPPVAQGRGIWGLSLTLSLVLLTGGRLLLSHVRHDEAFRRRVLIYGAGKRAASILQLRRRSDQRGFRIIAFVRAPGDCSVIADARVREPSGSLLEFARQHAIEEIVVAMDDRRRGFPMHELLDCKFSGIHVIDVVNFLERESGRINVELMNPSWIVFSEGFTHRPARQITARALDIIASATLLLLTWPLMLVVAAAILLEDRRPILYRQTRVGFMGQPFQLLGDPRPPAANQIQKN